MVGLQENANPNTQVPFPLESTHTKALNLKQQKALDDVTCDAKRRIDSIKRRLERLEAPPAQRHHVHKVKQDPERAELLEQRVNAVEAELSQAHEVLRQRSIDLATAEASRRRAEDERDSATEAREQLQIQLHSCLDSLAEQEAAVRELKEAALTDLLARVSQDKAFASAQQSMEESLWEKISELCVLQEAHDQHKEELLEAKRALAVAEGECLRKSRIIAELQKNRSDCVTVSTQTDEFVCEHCKGESSWRQHALQLEATLRQKAQALTALQADLDRIRGRGRPTSSNVARVVPPSKRVAQPARAPARQPMTHDKQSTTAPTHKAAPAPGAVVVNGQTRQPPGPPPRPAQQASQASQATQATHQTANPRQPQAAKPAAAPAAAAGVTTRQTGSSSTGQQQQNVQRVATSARLGSSGGMQMAAQQGYRQPTRQWRGGAWGQRPAQRGYGYGW